jgi:hypothetical protein
MQLAWQVVSLIGNKWLKVGVGGDDGHVGKQNERRNQ